jgi:uncharacterized protein (TIGR03435 family)
MSYDPPTAMFPALSLTLILILATTSTIASQSPAPSQQNSAPTAFDVVSIRPSDPNLKYFTSNIDPNNFKATGVTLQFLVQNAYDLHDFQIEGAPSWMKSARFDIAAKVDAPTTSATSPQPQDWEARHKLLQTRLQSLLADRFQFQVHKSSKEMPVYGLVVAKGGPNLQASTKKTGYKTARGQFVCSATSMIDLADMLTDVVSRTVLDQTKLTGEYAFTLKWNPNETTNTTSDLPGIFTALQEQLGLKLIPTKGPVEILTIDHVEMPSEN